MDESISSRRSYCYFLLHVLFLFLRAYGHFLPLQVTPSPEYPSLQEQLKEPRVLLQVARE